MVSAIFEYFLDEDDGSETYSVIGLFNSASEAKNIVYDLPPAYMPYGCYYIQDLPIGCSLNYDIDKMERFEVFEHDSDDDISDRE